MSDDQVVVRGCSGHYSGGCTAELRVPRGGRDAAKTAARAAGWRTWTPRLYGQSMMTVFTCPDCVQAER